ncbi:galactosyl transferase CpsE [Citreicella sp. SE45]|nr:galactosyl transferase CpsE [Citreicella sp. SE45]
MKSYVEEDDHGRTSQALDFEHSYVFAGDINWYRGLFKRALDVMCVIFMLPTALSVIALFAALVAIDGGNPFYSQIRVGQGGRLFRMWKLRSMVHGADAMLEDHLAADPDARKEWDATQKLKNDPRVTAIGKIIRKTSVDELPQLWNVLRGDMSLVGPRPMMPSQEELYPGRAYYRLRPGITGPWQISERHLSDFVERARFDSAYDRELSLGTDFHILRRTITVVFRATGV